MGKITLLTGGARSGKSSYALKLALNKNGQRIFVATAIGFDKEMQERIKNHKLERGAAFKTIEAPVDLSKALKDVPRNTTCLIIDCMTVWLGNLYYQFKEDEQKIRQHINETIHVLQKVPFEVFVVTNEVGWSIVPENILARKFRDMSGFMNKSLAFASKRVYLCVCGIPLKVK